MGPRWWRHLVLLAGVVLVSTGCAALQQQASNSPESSPSSSVESPTPSTSPIGTATPTGSKPALLTITSASFHAGEVGIAYAPVTLQAGGGVPPYTWTISAGALPGGLQAASAGSVSGTPTVASTFAFTVHVADTASGTAIVNRSITVYSKLAITQSCATKCIIGAGCSRCGAFGSASRGLGPYKYTIVGGAVPRGMSWSGLSLKGGFPVGAYALSVQVTDQLGAQATVGANWSIYAAATLTAGSSCSNFGNPPQCSTSRWSYSGGNPSTAPKVVILGYKQYCLTGCYPIPTAPPPGWAVSVKSGTITMSAGGIACNAPAYEGYLTIALVDPTKCATTFRSNSADLLVDISNNC
jgi:hypothetical protein